MSKRRVTYYYHPDVGAYTYGRNHVMKPQRIAMTHELVSVYDMLDKMHVIKPRRATPEMMTAFHTDEYISFLSRVTPETADALAQDGTRYLSNSNDNPTWDGVFEYSSISAGGSIAAAHSITSGATDIAINWAGGLHHAKKRQASGFCYINDIVLCALELLRTYPRVLYIDIDCHHGDGVEEAFYSTDRVMTCSFHRYGDFFPYTGNINDTGLGKGKGYAVNVPFHDGLSDECFQALFEPIISKILEVFRPSAIILQCGADSLSGDKIGHLNLTMKGHAHAVQFVRSQNIPLVLVGGGGYTVKNVGRTWAYETACALGIEHTLDENLPWNEYFEWFGPRYRLEVVASNAEDLNLRDGWADYVLTTVLQDLSRLPHAPSVGLHDVPAESVDQHLGFDNGEDDEDTWDDLDKKIARHSRHLYDTHATGFEEEDEDYCNARSSDGGDIPYFDIPSSRPGYEHYNLGGLSTTAERRFFHLPDPCSLSQTMARGGTRPHNDPIVNFDADR